MSEVVAHPTNTTGGRAGTEPERQRPPESISPPELWSHQKEAVGRLASLADIHGGALLDSGMGTGKTRTLLQLAAMASDIEKQEQSQPTCSLVVAPNSALSVWEQENETYFQGRYRFVRRQGSASVAKFADQLAEQLASPEADMLVAITYDNLRNDKLMAVLKAQRWAAVICDESHRLLNSKPLKAGGTQISHIAGTTNWDARWRFAASGTTHPRSLLELHGQIRFAAPNWVPADWNAFVKQHATVSSSRYRKPGTVVIGQQRDRTLTVAAPTKEFARQLSTAEAPIHIAPPVEQLIDLPDLIHIPIECEMSAEARKIYNQLEEKGGAWLPDGQHIVADNPHSSHDWTVHALQQVTAGKLKDWQPQQDTKMEAVKDLVEGLPPEEKVVVFCHWRHDHQAVQNKFKNQTETVAGGMTVEQRAEAIRRWETGDKQILTFATSIAEGVSLTAARHAIFLSTPWQPHAFAQAQARLHRAGQTRKVLVAMLLATNQGDKTVDHAQYNLLMKHASQTKKDNQQLAETEPLPMLAAAVA